ncbi:MAG: hypothetical protein FWD28_01265 [Treponema sp.]|nr:hypothetical protein [Treponema sp.]
MFKKAILLIIILVLVSASAVFADSFQWAGMGSLFYFASSNPGAGPAAIVPSVGFAASWPLFDIFRLEVTEDIYFTNYEFNKTLGYPMITGPENRAAFVIGFLTAAQFTAVFPIGDNGILARAYGGFALDIRLAIRAFGLNHPADIAEAQAQTDAIFSYFWSNGRFFLPVVGGGMDFPVNDYYFAGFDLRIWIPLYRLLTNENIPAIDGWRIGVSLRITPRQNSR